MIFKLKYSDDANDQLAVLRNDPSNHRILKDVLKALKLMETNLRHPSLNTHEYHAITGPNGEKIFEAYAQQKTASAFRIFWHYGPGKSVISIVSILQHPD